MKIFAPNRYYRSLAIMAGILASVTTITPAAWALTIDVGTTTTVDSTPGTPYTHTEAGNITINGTLRGYERATPGGAYTGNGGNIHLTTTGGVIVIGALGRINVDAKSGNGNGGTIVLTGPTITVDGKLTADGINAGSGGTIQLVGDTINLNAGSLVSARGITANSNGGIITVTSTGVTSIANTAVVNSSGKTVLSGPNVTQNLITISGNGVNINGAVTANGIGSTRAGKVSITATSGASEVNVASTGRINAIGASGTGSNGGEIVVTGNLTNNGGQLSAVAGGTNKNAGSITVTGSNSNYFVNQSNGKLLANGFTTQTDSDGGTITVNTGSITLNQGTLEANGSKNTGATGAGGSISLTANGTLDANASSQVTVQGTTGGNVSLNSNTGTININAGSWIRAMGDSTTTMSVSGNSVNVASTLEAGGMLTNQGGTLTLTVNNSGDLLMSGNGLLSSRGGETGNGNGGTVIVSARDITLNDSANIRAYGTENVGAGTLGNGGVITLTASRNYSSAVGTTVNSSGDPVIVTGNYTKNLITLTAGGTTNLDGKLLAQGRGHVASDGGKLNLTSTGTLTVASTALISASGNVTYGGKGGQIYLRSVSGNVNLTGGGGIVDGTLRGIITTSGMMGSIGGLMNITAGSGITLSAIQLSATGSTSGNISLLANAGNLSIANSTVAGSLLTLQASNTLTATTGNTFTASNGIAIYGESGTSDDVTQVDFVKESGDLTLSRLRATTANVSTVGTNAAITVSALGSTNGTINLTTGKNITISNAVVDGADTLNLNSTNNGNIVLVSGTFSSLTGTTTAPSGSGGVRFRTTTGNVTLTNNTVTGATSVGTAGAIMAGTITGTGNTFTGSTSFYTNTATKNISITTSDFQNATNAFSGFGVTVGDSAGGLTLSTLTAGSTFTGSSTGGAMTISNAAVTGASTLTASGAITGNTSTNWANIAATSTGGGAINLADSTGNMTLTTLSTSGNSTLLASGGSLTISGASLTGVGSTATWQAATSVDASNTGNNIASNVSTYGLGGAGSALTTATLYSTTGLTVNALNTGTATLTANGGNMSVSNATITGATTLTASGSITATSANNFGTTNTLSAGTSLALTDSTGALTITSMTAGTNATIATGSASDLTISAATVGGNLSALAGTAGSSQNLTINNTVVTGTSTLQAGNSITATSAGNRFVGSVSAYGESSTADLTTNGINITNNNQSLVVGRYMAGTGGALIATGAGSDVSVDNANMTSGTLTITSPDAIALSNSTFSALKTLRASSSSNGAVTLTNNTFSTLEGKNTLTGSENNGAYIGNGNGNWTMSGNTVSSTTTFTSIGGSVTASSGTFTGVVSGTAAAVDITATSALSVGSLVATSGAISLNSTGNISTSSSGGTTAATSVSLVSTGGNITVGDPITGTDVTIQATGASKTVTVSGGTIIARNGTAGGNVNIFSDGTFTLNSNFDILASATAGGALGGSINISSNGAINISTAGSILQTNGLTDATHNKIVISGASFALTGDMEAMALSSGGAGGTVNITTTTGNVTLSNGSYIKTVGYATAAGVAGNGGNVTINAGANFVQTGGTIQTYVQSATAAAATKNGGAVAITAGGNITQTYMGSVLIDTRGASFATSGIAGGNGGNITLTANSGAITMTKTTGGTPVYFDLRGGNGVSAAGGNGGSINLFNTSYSINSYTGIANFRTQGGGGSPAGTQGHLYNNGSQLF